MSDRNDTYILNVNRYKDDLADFIDLTWDNSQSQQPRFMNFPTPSDGKYTQTSFFIEFEGEHKIMELNKNGDAMASRWKKKKDASRNHFWDVRVYILALKDIYSDIICRELGHEIGDKQIAKYPSWEGFCKIMKYNLYGEEN